MNIALTEKSTAYPLFQRASAGGLQRQALFSIALVLFVFIMIINVVLNVVLKGGDRDA